LRGNLRTSSFQNAWKFVGIQKKITYVLEELILFGEIKQLTLQINIHPNFISEKRAKEVRFTCQP
jgi:hypothetical protein